MCARFYIADDREDEIRQIIDRLSRQEAGIKTSGEIFPSDTVPVVANSRSLKEGVFAMKWGYTLSDGKPIINARSETAGIKPMFQDGIKNRRCLIPASYYFEWEKESKTKYLIKPSDHTFFYFAGIYRIEQGKPVFSILTKSPAASIQFIHDRMPVILPAEAKSDWLNLNYSANDVLRNALGTMEYTQA